MSKCNMCGEDVLNCEFCNIIIDGFYFCTKDNKHFCSVSCICDSLGVVSSYTKQKEKINQIEQYGK